MRTFVSGQRRGSGAYCAASMSISRSCPELIAPALAGLGLLLLLDAASPSPSVGEGESGTAFAVTAVLCCEAAAGALVAACSSSSLVAAESGPAPAVSAVLSFAVALLLPAAGALVAGFKASAAVVL